MQGYYQRSSTAPVCPVCHGRHLPATNGAGYRVHCDGSRVDTDGEHAARGAALRLAALAHERMKADMHSKAAHKGAATRRRNRARLLLQAEHAARADDPPIDPTIDCHDIPEGI